MGHRTRARACFSGRRLPQLSQCDREVPARIHTERRRRDPESIYLRSRSWVCACCLELDSSPNSIGWNETHATDRDIGCLARRGRIAVAMSATAAAAEDTFPKLLIRNAGLFAATGRPIRHKDLGIWQTWTWAQVLDEVRAFSVGLAAARPQARRQGRDHRHQPAAPLLGDVRGAGARRRAGAGLCRTPSPTRWPTCSIMPR